MEKNNDKEVIEFIFLGEDIDIEDLLERIRQDKHIPIVQATNMDLDWDYERIINGFTLDDAKRLMEAQLDYENYEGAAFLLKVIVQIEEELTNKELNNINE